MKDEELSEQETEDRFNRLVGNLVNTPHKPYVLSKPPSGAEKPKPG